MSDKKKPSTPKEMGDQLDEEIQETVQDWAATEGEDYDDLDERIDARLRRRIAGWVGAEEDAGWKDIGGKMDANTRSSIAGWVGAEEEADWVAITGRIENRVRFNIAKVVRVRKEEEDEEARWSDIGSKLESDIRGLFGGLVGAEEDAGWKDIGGEISTKIRQAFDKLRGTDQEEEAAEEERPTAIKIDIEGEDEAPAVKSEEPVEPED